MSLSLVMNPGLPGEQTFALPVGVVTIGRTKDNDVSCAHKSLSRKHAKLEFDGAKVQLTDLQSKNGVFFNGHRVARCQLTEGATFRCGDITFLLEGSTTRSPKMSIAAQTLPSPLATEISAARAARAGAAAAEAHARHKERVFALTRAGELLVGALALETYLEEVVALTVQVLEVDRIALRLLEEGTLEMKPRVLKTFVKAQKTHFSKRVVDWVVDHATPVSFPDVSREKALAGDAERDAHVRSAIAAPLNPGGGAIGVLYADSLSLVDAYQPDDVTLLRAMANLAAIAIEIDALRRAGPSGPVNTMTVK